MKWKNKHCFSTIAMLDDRIDVSLKSVASDPSGPVWRNNTYIQLSDWSRKRVFFQLTFLFQEFSEPSIRLRQVQAIIKSVDYFCLRYVASSTNQTFYLTFEQRSSAINLKNLKELNNSIFSLQYM